MLFNVKIVSKDQVCLDTYEGRKWETGMDYVKKQPVFGRCWIISENWYASTVRLIFLTVSATF